MIPKSRFYKITISLENNFKGLHSGQIYDDEEK